MNAININPTSFGTKAPISRIKMARSIGNRELPVDNYVKEMLEQHGSKIEKVADYFGRDVVIAQNGKTLLANSGAHTTAIDMRKMENGEELINGIIENIKTNSLH